MSIHQFITRYDINPADAIVLNKKFFGMVDHYVIYLGFINLRHTFVANYVHGVKVLQSHEIEQYLQVYVPSKIDKYPGLEEKRGEALQRAMSLIGQKAYNFIANNCEHFKNFVHYGIRESTQVQKAGFIAIMGGLGLTLLGAGKKNDGLAAAGVLIILIGIIVALMARPAKTNDKKDEEH